MKIIISGCAGMIGYNLSKYLLSRGHQIIGIDCLKNNLIHIPTNTSTSLFYKNKRLGELKNNENFIYYSIDMCEINNQSAFDQKGAPVTMNALTSMAGNIDAFIHLAALPSVPISEGSPSIFLAANYTSTCSALDAARILGCKFLYASSSSIYGTHTNADENTSNLSPLGVYAQSKLQGERLIEFYHNKYAINALSMRFFTVFGEYSRPDMLTHLTLNSIYTDRTLEIYNKGQNKRDFMYCGDLCHIITHILEKSLFHNYEILNIGPGAPTSVLDFINCFESVAQHSSKKNIVPNKRLFEPTITSCNNKKLLSLMGPEFKFSPLLEAVKITHDHYRKIYLSLPTLSYSKV